MRPASTGLKKNSKSKIPNKYQLQSSKEQSILELFSLVILMLFGIWQLGFAASAWAEEKVSRIDFEDAAVINVVQTLSRSAGLDLVLAGDQATLQNKRATIHLKDISIEEAIEQILHTNGFNYEKKGNTLLISALPQDLSQSAYKPEVEIVALKHLAAGRAVELFTKIYPNVCFQVGEKACSLVIRGRPSEIEEVKKLLPTLDQLAPQILIESKVMELSQSDSQRLGISYGNGAFRFLTAKDTKKTSLAEDLSSVLNALIADGKANVIASPRIATLDNREALINIGNRIPFAVPVTSSSGGTQWTVDYIDAGVKLKITPQLGQGGEITTFIQPEVSSVSEWRTTPAGDFPVISTRNASATVRVKDGETIVIGGLLSESERENITKVPVLGYIPLVGLFFQNKSTEKEKTEVVFLITPRVI